MGGEFGLVDSKTTTDCSGKHASRGVTIPRHPIMIFLCANMHCLLVLHISHVHWLREITFFIKVHSHWQMMEVPYWVSYLLLNKSVMEFESRSSKHALFFKRLPINNGTATFTLPGIALPDVTLPFQDGRNKISNRIQYKNAENYRNKEQQPYVQQQSNSDVVVSPDDKFLPAGG